MDTKHTTQEKETPPAVTAPYPGLPRWVKVLAIVAIILVILIAIAFATGLGGPHGPGRHLPSSNIAPLLAASTFLTLIATPRP